MKTRHWGRDLAIGAAAGLGGTALIQGLMVGSARVAPSTLPPVKDNPGRFMVKQAQRLLPGNWQGKIPEKAEVGASVALAFGYGMSFGALYAALRPQTRNTLLEGTALGATTWAVGHLGWLPATKLMPPIWRQTARQVIASFVSHALFGIATVGLFKWWRSKIAA